MSMPTIEQLNEALKPLGVRVTAWRVGKSLDIESIRKDFGRAAAERMVKEGIPGTQMIAQIFCTTAKREAVVDGCATVANSAVREFAKALKELLADESVFWQAGSEQEKVFQMYLDRLLPEEPK